MRIGERDREGNSQEKHKAVDSRATLFPVASWRGACASARVYVLRHSARLQWRRWHATTPRKPTRDPSYTRATVASVYTSRKRGWNNDTRSRFFPFFFFLFFFLLTFIVSLEERNRCRERERERERERRYTLNDANAITASLRDSAWFALGRMR